MKAAWASAMVIATTLFGYFLAIIESMEIEILVFYYPPQAFDKNVILEIALAIHADPDIVLY